MHRGVGGVIPRRAVDEHAKLVRGSIALAILPDQNVINQDIPRAIHQDRGAVSKTT